MSFALEGPAYKVFRRASRQPAVKAPPGVHPYPPRFVLRRSEMAEVNMETSSDLKIGTVVGTKMVDIAKVRVESLKLDKKVLKVSTRALLLSTTGISRHYSCISIPIVQ